ncbi:MAG: hypothetical protein HQL32_17420 [Planctomycetes bacterium]|nr:hypothetical protein [Planctomycetota bacterium]
MNRIIILAFISVVTFGHADINGPSEILFDVNNDSQNEMTLNSTGLGIGISPAANLHVNGNSIISTQVFVGATSGSSNLNISGTMAYEVSTVSSNVTLGDSSLVMADSSTKNLYLTLPYAGNAIGRTIDIKKISASNNIWISGGGNLIDKMISLELAATSSSAELPGVSLISDGEQWYILNQTGTVSNGSIMLEHIFDGGGGNLHGTSLDTNLIGAGTWNARADISPILESGNVGGKNGTSAWVSLNGALSMGGADDFYEVEFVVDSTTSTSEFEGGFWGPSNPSTTGKNAWQSGTAFWQWDADSIKTYTGAGTDGLLSDVAQARSTLTITLQLDLTDATLTNNTLRSYIGTSASGTLLGTGAFSGDESFDELGVSGRPENDADGSYVGVITSIKLTRFFTE